MLLLFLLSFNLLSLLIQCCCSILLSFNLLSLLIQCCCSVLLPFNHLSLLTPCCYSVLFPFNLLSLLIPCCCSVLLPFNRLSLIIPCRCPVWFPLNHISLLISCCCSFFLFPFNYISFHIPGCFSVFLFPFTLLFLFTSILILDCFVPLYFSFFWYSLLPCLIPFNVSFSSYTLLLLCLLGPLLKFILFLLSLPLLLLPVISVTPCCCSDLFHFTIFLFLFPTALHCFPLLFFLFIFNAAALSSCPLYLPFSSYSMLLLCLLVPFTCPSLLIPCCCSVFLFHFNLIYLFLFLSPAADPLSSPFSSYPMLLICLLVGFNLSLCIHCCCSIVLFPFNLISLIPCYCSVKLFPFNLLSSLLTSAVLSSALSSRRHFIFCFFVSFAAAMLSYSP